MSRRFFSEVNGHMLVELTPLGEAAFNDLKRAVSGGLLGIPVYFFIDPGPTVHVWPAPLPGVAVMELTPIAVDTE